MDDPFAPAELKRALGLARITLYGLGTIIGAGIYVLVGAVAGRAGMAAPLAFLLAGGLAAFTGLSYAELSRRFPEAAGEAAYAREAFGSDWMGRLTGFGTLLVALVAAASVARGGAGYVQPLMDVSVPLAAGLVIVAFTALAVWGVSESVTVAAAMTVVEIGGLVLVLIIGGSALEALPDRFAEMIPDTWPAWSGVLGGAFLAFFAFAGFENMVNMAEETRDVERTMPLAIVIAMAVTSALYVTVLLVSVLNVEPARLAASEAPLCLVVDCDQGVMKGFSVIALIATLNGVLIEIVLMARVAYGMARRGWLPSWIADVHPKRRTPIKATVLVGAIILALTTMFEFELLARMTSFVLLGVFLVVNLSLIRLKLRDSSPPGGFSVPLWVPMLGAGASLVLLAAELQAA